MDDSPGKDSKRASRDWLRAQSRLGRRAAMPVVALGLGGTLLAIGQAWCVAAALQAAIAGHAPPLALLALFALLAVLRAGLGVLSERAGFDAGAAARRRLRSDALGRMLAAGPALLRRSHSGELTAVLVDRIEALDGLFARWLPAATLAMAGPALVALAVLPADPAGAGLLLATGLLVPVAMALSGLGAAAASRRQFAAMARLQARFLDRIRGIATIVLAGRAEDEARALGRAADELRRRTMRVLRVAFLSSAALDCAAALALVLLALRYGAGLASGALGHPARALFVLLLVPEFFAPLRAFAAAYQERMQAAVAAEALGALPPAVPEQPPQAVRTVAARGVSVAFEDVRLTWDPARGPALDGLSFRVPAGEVLVLAGPSGAGKSSAMEVLLGFVRPDSGRVTINGADIATLVPQALARLIAWIGQRPVLFAGSIRDNIRFARPEATEDEVAEAARFARLDGVAALLPQGLDTKVGEGGHGLSGGQAQRVAIARAFLKNAPILLMDEPTAHLDPLTEAEVLESLKRLTVGRTVILASHSAAAHAFGGRRLDIRDGRVAPARGVA
ncbi:MAG: thiol reductant ABC exporter subunit CydD [Rhodospirillales bacterium 70-18]|nr:thiol reductant ABC exporter subunit CydD [Rhodospirillales bacterium]OJY64141.1 MAG: thiol reductant ABC exporter subunit CydD [Rhodospirillales bacterium 70-18]